MAASPELHRFSYDEYLDLEKRAESKSEYLGGRILAMSGGTAPHSELSVRMIVLLSQLRPRCRVFDSNLNLYIEQIRQGFYPDCMALCGDIQYYNNRTDSILNPTLVVEVLSPSTQGYDRGTKVSAYHSVPSIQHILLISQESVQVDHYARMDDRTWTMTRYSAREDVMRMLGIGIGLKAIYETIL